MGALGRCGGGAVECATRLGLQVCFTATSVQSASITMRQVLKWDKQETVKGGPFAQILTDADVFVNCILLQGNMQPFITRCCWVGRVMSSIVTNTPPGTVCKPPQLGVSV